MSNKGVYIKLLLLQEKKKYIFLNNKKKTNVCILKKKDLAWKMRLQIVEFYKVSTV